MISHSDFVPTVPTVPTLGVEPAISQNDFETLSVPTEKVGTVGTNETNDESGNDVTTKSVGTVGTNPSWHLYLAERPLPTDDPRPDLSHDSALWAALLALAHGYDNDVLLGNLNGLRCMGAGLTVRNGRVELWHRRMSQAEYDADRAKYLVPHAAEIVKLLAEVKA